MKKSTMKTAACTTIAALGLAVGGCAVNAQEPVKPLPTPQTTTPGSVMPHQHTAPATTPAKPQSTPQTTTPATPQKPAATTPAAKSPEQPAKTIADTLKGMTECSTFMKNAEKSGVAKEFSEKGPYTVLVPVNSAYEALPAKVRDDITKNEKKDKAVSRFHVLKGDYTVDALQTKNEIDTFCDEGEDCTMDFVEITKPAKNVILKEIPCSNGRIYLINMVLIPESLKEGSLLERTGKAVGSEAKNVYNESREAVGSGLKKASEFVTPTPAK